MATCHSFFPGSLSSSDSSERNGLHRISLENDEAELVTKRRKKTHKRVRTSLEQCLQQALDFSSSYQRANIHEWACGASAKVWHNKFTISAPLNFSRHWPNKKKHRVQTDLAASQSGIDSLLASETAGRNASLTSASCSETLRAVCGGLWG